MKFWLNAANQSILAYWSLLHSSFIVTVDTNVIYKRNDGFYVQLRPLWLQWMLLCLIFNKFNRIHHIHIYILNDVIVRINLIQSIECSNVHDCSQLIWHLLNSFLSCIWNLENTAAMAYNTKTIKLSKVIDDCKNSPLIKGPLIWNAPCKMWNESTIEIRGIFSFHFVFIHSKFWLQYWNGLAKQINKKHSINAVCLKCNHDKNEPFSNSEIKIYYYEKN